MAEEKKLTKSVEDKWLTGTLGGIAEHYGQSSMMVRIVFLVAGAFTGLGLLAYIVLFFVVPAPEEG